MSIKIHCFHHQYLLMPIIQIHHQYLLMPIIQMADNHPQILEFRTRQDGQTFRKQEMRKLSGFIFQIIIIIKMLLKERKNQHRKNSSLALGTGRSKRSSQQKQTALLQETKPKDRKISNLAPNTSRNKRSSQDKQTSRSKSKDQSRSKELQNRMLKRMSFQSPSRKEDSTSSKKFSLLNYMVLKEKTTQAHEKPMKRDNFSVMQVLGKGGFGRVMKVEFKKNRKLYAMKEMSKTVIITKKSIQSVQNQRQLLADLRHPFLVNMIYAFQDRDNLYLIMDLMPGGDLRYQIGKFGSFPEHIVKFFICCIIVGLEYMHSNMVIHRDIKPENLVLDEKGYLRITDLGVARIHSKENYRDTSGTPGYMAPEVICRQNHTFTVDFFALGVIAFECMLGKRPYKGYNRQQIREQMLLFEATVKEHMIPSGWDPMAADFINKMLRRKQQDRLGWKGIEEVKKHAWFNDISWQKMGSKKYPSPFMPNMEEQNYDTVSVSEYEEEYVQKLNQNALLLREKEVQQLFKGYEYQQVKFL